MDLNQLRKAISDGAEFEYLFDIDKDQWVPATVLLHDRYPGTPDITIGLLSHPRNHSG